MFQSQFMTPNVLSYKIIVLSFTIIQPYFSTFIIILGHGYFVLKKILTCKKTRNLKCLHKISQFSSRQALNIHIKYNSKYVFNLETENIYVPEMWTHHSWIVKFRTRVMFCTNWWLQKCSLWSLDVRSNQTAGS